ncbi:hypothetical protein PoB_006750400 [Plakobranchus ocellatus]|uniref:Mutator-like transposase domain-containing protein n=1 Tax=Plakobranchus ocellatus TaxID=259542 RepID=A0AAV4DA05_9GAST|nr:hypothetical protein PoB_006750400 [Plakobranchus ocellatus]
MSPEEEPPLQQHCERTIIDVSQVGNLVSQLSCSSCASQTLEVRVNRAKSKGMSLKLEAFCTSCNSVVASTFSSKQEEGSVYTVHKAAVLSALLCSLGPITFRYFCQNSNMPALHPKTFNKIADRLFKEQDRVDRIVFEETVAKVRQEHARDRGIDIDEETILDVAVSYDGTWLTRGHQSHIGIGSLHPKTFNKIADRLFKEQDRVDRIVFEETVAKVRQQHARDRGIDIDEDTILDIAVSYDGTWLTRGHQSHIGIGCVIDVLTGLVIDCLVLSDFCQVCATTGKIKRQGHPDAYRRWLETHKEEGCDKNYDGTSGMMEVKVAEILWLRSIERHKLRYVTLVSDGDSKAYNRICEVAPYGEAQIEKEECLNHVGKRLGTALRNLVSDCSKRKITLGGRGKGTLTQKAIRKLSIYYSRAIRSAPTAHEKQRAVLASLFHCYSTDNNPQHQFCPVGKDSFCFYQSALAKKETPGPHSVHIHTPLNRKLLHSYIYPVYKRLSDPALMKRCQLAATQNANESLHNAIWSKCSKEKFYTRRTVRFRATSAIAEFSAGPVWAHKKLMEAYGLATGADSTRLARQRQQKRLDDSQYAAKKKMVKRRQQRREARRKLLAELQEAKGGQAYGAGIA